MHACMPDSTASRPRRKEGWLDGYIQARRAMHSTYAVHIRDLPAVTISHRMYFAGLETANYDPETSCSAFSGPARVHVR